METRQRLFIQLNRGIRSGLILLVLGVVITACTTNTLLDQLWYPSDTWGISVEQTEYDRMCFALEAGNYNFDYLEVNNRFRVVYYPDGHQVEYPTGEKSVAFTLFTSIQRNFDNPQEWSDAEVERLRIQAQEVCQAVQTIAEDLYGTPIYVSLTMQDWIVGAQAIIYTEKKGDCSSLTWQSFSYGSYGDDMSGMTCTQEQ
jgi:hypothetical protein